MTHLFQPGLFENTSCCSQGDVFAGMRDGYEAGLDRVQKMVMRSVDACQSPSIFLNHPDEFPAGNIVYLTQPYIKINGYILILLAAKQDQAWAIAS